MCFDSPDPPDPPDYTPLAKASEKSANQSYELAKRQQDWAEKTYAENSDLRDVIVEQTLGMMDKQERWADQDRSRYETIFQPLEEQLAAEAESYASPARLEYEAGKAEADVAAQFAQARQAAMDQLESYGVDPSQTRAMSAQIGSRLAEAAAQAGSGNMARTNAENIGRALRSEAINVGKGYPSQAGAAATGSLQAGNQGMNSSLATTASGANTMGTGQTWQGLGNNAINTWGSVLNNGYSNQMDAWKAKQDSSSGFGQLIGTVAGMAIPFLAEGGAIPDMDEGAYLPEEMSPSGGAIPDDIDAEIEGGAPAKLNAGEFIVPKDVVSWLGEKGMQQMILKARKEMTGANGERPAQPEMGPDPSMPPPPPIPPELAGAIPV